MKMGYEAPVTIGALHGVKVVVSHLLHGNDWYIVCSQEFADKLKEESGNVEKEENEAK